MATASPTTARPNPEAGWSDERAVLLGWLEFHRTALAMKCDGLTGEQLAAMTVPPSNLSLLGLVRHMTEMENAYFRYGLGGGRVQMIYEPTTNLKPTSSQWPAANSVARPPSVPADQRRTQRLTCAADQLAGALDRELVVSRPDLVFTPA